MSLYTRSQVAAIGSPPWRHLWERRLTTPLGKNRLVRGLVRIYNRFHG
jgi:hypothetical protein